MTHRFINIDGKSRELLTRLGKLSGNETIDAKDLAAKEAKEILAEIPFLSQKSRYGIEPLLEDAKNLEKLRAIAQKHTTGVFAWSRIDFNEKGRIQGIAPAKDHIHMAEQLIKNPERTIREIQKNLARHVRELPPDWSLAKADGKIVDKRFMNLLLRIEETNAPSVGVPAEYIGSEMATFYYDIVTILKMSSLVKRGTTNEKQRALNYLDDMMGSVQFLILTFSGRDPETGEKQPPPHSIYQTAKAIFLVLNIALGATDKWIMKEKDFPLLKPRKPTSI